MGIEENIKESDIRKTMETDTKYGIRKAELREMLPEIDLFPTILHAGKQLDIAVFGPDIYKNNISNMQKKYFHSRQLPNISFRPATSAESTSILVPPNFKYCKTKILNPRGLQLCREIKTSDGVYLNPQKNTFEGDEVDEKTLKSFLKPDKKVNGIYLLDNDFTFVPYESFEQGVQESGDFAEGGLARGLEHTQEKKASNLAIISDKKNYPRGVNVFRFDPVTEAVVRVVCLYSYRGYDGLIVVGDGWNDGDDCCAFGVLN